MDFTELKRSIGKIQIVKTVKEKKEDVYSGYYTLPCTKEPFLADVIKLSGPEFNAFFQEYSDGNEDRFRAKLEKMDEWFYDKPYRVQQGWMGYVTKWLLKETTQ